MKTSQGDASNREVIQEIRKLSDRVGALETGQSDLLEAVQGLAEHTDQRFSKIESEMVTKTILEDELSKVKTTMATKDDLAALKTTMVTKGYLDDKLADLQSNMLQTTRREIQKALG